MSTTSSQIASPQKRKLKLLIWIAGLSAACYLAIAWLSQWFDASVTGSQRPIIGVLVLLAMAFVLYCQAVLLAIHLPPSRRLTGLIVIAACLFRVIMLVSVPIQEIDIYRYMWDGAVSSQGISPWRYTPKQIESAGPRNTQDKDLLRLVHLCEQNPSLATVLERVHYEHLPTIYPATSQAVFWLATQTTPAQASVNVRLLVMKFWLVVCDLGVVLLVIKLLQLCQLPVALSLIYAWCPLVMKEIANSGHLDSIAVLLTTLAIYLLARALFAHADRERGSARQTAILMLAALVLAAAIGAKLYPVILIPLIAWMTIKRMGWTATLLSGAVVLVATTVLLWPMLPRAWVSDTDPTGSSVTPGQVPALPIEIGTTPIDMPPAIANPDDNDPGRGLTVFLSEWEMNDFVFMLVHENLKPGDLFPKNRAVWFSIVPGPWRKSVVDFAADSFSISKKRAPFLITRVVTGVAFLLIAGWLAVQAARCSQATGLFRAAFLTIAWFWLLSPTQNPWYWLWALPLLPFVRNRAWLAISGLVLIYYLRFWFRYQLEHTAVAWTPYSGSEFFDYVVTWFEYGPWFVWLSVESLRGWKRTQRD